MTADSIFLERIAISNFRAYPQDFEIHLPPGPGVTVLSGPNGLGKTSLFEAVEWALTADVKRLSAFTKRRLDGRYLLRRDSGTSCEVSLVFSGDVHVRRLQTVGKTISVIGTEREEVAEAIRVPDSRWMVSGENLAEYLHLTHFHPQAAELRLVSETPGERWLRISPLAGADRFDRFRSNLRNARTALTRSIERQEAVVRAAVEREALWHQRLDQLRTMSAVDRAAYGALSPRDVVGTVAPVARRLQRAVPPADAVTSAQAADFLANTKGDLDRSVAAASSEGARLRELAELPSKWASMRATHEAARERQSKANANVREAVERTAMEETRAAERAAEAQRAAADASQIEQRHRIAVSLRSHESELERIAAQLRALEAERGRLETTVTAVQASVQEHTSAQRQLRTYETARKVAEEAVRAIKAAVLSLAESRDLVSQLVQQRERISKQNVQLEELRLGRLAIDSEFQVTTEARDGVMSRINAETSKLGEIAQAVAAIAAHLTAHDTTCPVCKTDFPEDGTLRGRALRQAIGISASMNALQQELEIADRNLEYLQSKRREIVAQIRATEQDLASLTAIATRLARRIESLQSLPLLSPLDGAEERLAKDAVEQELEVISVSAKLAESPEEGDIVAALSAARLNQAEITRSIESNSTQAMRLAAEQSELLAKVNNARQVLDIELSDELADIVSRLALELADADTRRARAVEAANAARAAYDVATQDVETARVAMESSSAEVIRAKDELAALQNRWSDAHLPGEPAEALFQNASLDFATKQTALMDSLRTLAAAAAGLQDWQRLDVTRALEADLSAEAQGAALEEYGAILASETSRAKRQLAGAQGAYAASEDLTTAIRTIGDDFGGSAIAPFGEVFKAFLRALVRDARFHRVSPEYSRVQGGSNVLRFNIELGATTANPFQVEMVLSEGQLSEVSLAAMLAASCMYPWSRWRGVLLDDPTQYQDLTHSSSLFEVIRNLAVDAGFQVVVAVHDRAQSDFLLRKLQSARVPYVECEYLAMGPHGAVTRVNGSGPHTG